MSSLFIGKSGLRHQFAELTATAINATTGASDALLLATYRQASQLCFLFNGTAMDIAFYLVHPDADPAVTANRLLWYKHPANFNLNYEQGMNALRFDPGSKLYVAKADGTGTTGFVRIVTWG